MIVVLDSNIWLGELGLNSSLGAAVRFFLRQRQAQLAVPEVVRLEVERNSRDKIEKYKSVISENYRQLLTIFGKLKEVVLPTEQEIEAKIPEIFSGVGVELLDIPFSLESARSSFLKIIAKLPPNKERDQQFKDGVIWADCVALLRRDEVYFVTSDKAFFEEQKPEKGLARNLADEVVGLPHEIRVFYSLSELLPNIKVEIPLDDDLLVQSFLDSQRQHIDPMLERQRFRLENHPAIHKTLSATEDPSVLYVSFEIDMPCADTTDEGRKEAILHLKGDGSYHIQKQMYSDMHILDQSLGFVSADGNEVISAVVFASANIFLGHKDVPNPVRYLLTE